MKIQRTYPTPDSNRDSVGPRERAMAVYKYLLSMEPEAAVNDRMFNVIQNAFMQEQRRGARMAILRYEAAIERAPRYLRGLLRRIWRKLDPAFDMPVLGPSLLEAEVTGSIVVPDRVNGSIH